MSEVAFHLRPDLLSLSCDPGSGSRDHKKRDCAPSKTQWWCVSSVPGVPSSPRSEIFSQGKQQLMWEKTAKAIFGSSFENCWYEYTKDDNFLSLYAPVWSGPIRSPATRSVHGQSGAGVLIYRQAKRPLMALLSDQGMQGEPGLLSVVAQGHATHTHARTHTHTHM